MSKHHQSHRRRSYGRRQHELHERQVELRDPNQIDSGDTGRDDGTKSGVRFELDTASHRLSYSVGD
jgi:hypothetical protein